MLKRIVPCVLLVGLLTFGCQKEAQAPRQADPRVEQVLRQMSDLLRSTPALRLRERSVRDERLADSDQTIEVSRTADILVARPNRLCVAVESDDGAKWTAWYDGQTIALLDRAANEYATEPFAGTIKGLLAHLVEKYGLALPLADFLHGETRETLRASIPFATYLGIHTVAGRPCHHLLCRQPEFDWQLWVDAGEKPLPRKMTITFKQQPGHPQFETTTEDWDLAPQVSDEQFRFTPPAGATRVTVADLIRED